MLIHVLTVPYEENAPLYISHFPTISLIYIFVPIPTTPIEDTKSTHTIVEVKLSIGLASLQMVQPAGSLTSFKVFNESLTRKSI